MNYSEGMGIELPVWVIQSKSGKKTFNIKLNKFQRELTEDCLFSTPEDANDKLKMLDFGYVVNRKRHYIDSNISRIW